MRYLFLFILSVLIYSSNAREISRNEFPLIQPISLEEADISLNNYFADSDKDGVHDDKDKCPQTLNGNKVDLFGCMILNDTDNDGVANKNDKCPNTQDGITVNLKGCEPDYDEDGVPDTRDSCPDTSTEFIVDNVGCPQTAVLKINFKAKEFIIMDDTLPEVENFALFLLDNKSYQAIIYGYTDSENSTGNNKQLSQKRANAVMEVLIGHGVKLTRLTAIGMGSKNPIAENSTPEGRAKNRRIEIELLQ
ncbi:MAG: OOP family OmpA-OmpF porin [Sulfurimonas sp.]|jgi:OOP family OmpA-OmpF porin|uniref:OmpA family protein n=1 Tax=Sulfurimonas sp. TaxID=2022749 RepID=UPI0039E656A6